MLWLIAAIAVGALLAVAIVSFGLRRSVLVFAAIMLAGLVSLIWYAEFRDDTADGFPGASLRMQGFAVTPIEPGRYRAGGRVFNSSSDLVLKHFELRVYAKDCNASNDCVVIGDQGARFDVDIPAGQARDIEHVFEFSNMRPRGRLAWDYRILPRNQ